MYLPKSPRATFSQLRSFEAVARLGGVTKAAQALHLTQPTVSTQLRELRESLGVDLLVPAGRGVQLTDAGRALLQTVTRMFVNWSEFEDGVADLQGLLRGSLRIAGVTTTEYFLAQWLKPFVDAYPGIEVDLVIDNRDAVVRRLERGLDDLAVMMMPPNHLAIDSLTVMDNPLILIGPAGHPWQARKTTPLKQVAMVDLLMREAGSGTRQATLEFLGRHSLAARIRMTLGSNEAIKHAVAAGLGLAIVSRHTLAKNPEQEGLCVLPVTGLPIKRKWQAVWRQDRRLPRVARVFMEFVQRQLVFKAGDHGGIGISNALFHES
ncbi:MAG: LysR family transcriptional regulator [Polaromonas sp.]|uniref:LysR family transcriptional regulator n=1 Tax=Polaromonas sp. TaxID=1869339 RepID=UPI0027368E00|nr:LysR family transcriptional regulator [Polaromonas sp.]MDP2819251.1 LysR family transcriptional regulator [Polaromonas sp.]